MHQLKSSFSILVLLLLTSHLSAQKLGIRAGINSANMIVKQPEAIIGVTPQSRAGAHFEVLGYKPIDSLFAVEAAIGVSTKGYVVRLADNKKESDYPFEIFGRRSVTYLEIPLRAKIQKKLGKLNYFAAVGPQMSIGIISKWNTEKDLEHQNTIQVNQSKWNNQNDINSLKRMDFGLFAGLGFEFKSLMVELSYTGSLGNIATVDGRVAKNRVFSLSVGRYFVKSVHPQPKEKQKGHYRKISSKKKHKKHRRHRRRR